MNIILKVCQLIVFMAFLPIPLSAQIVLKCATVAPEGTEWTKLAKGAADEVEKKTGIKLTWYLSGTVGDEPEIAKNLKEKKIDCAALTGNGLTYLIPPMRVVELPMIFKDASEAEKLRNEISSLLAKIAKDYKLKFVHLGEFGSVHVFSKFPIRTPDDIRGRRVWIWKGDILAEHMGKILQEEYGIKPVPVPLMDVSTYLQNMDVLYNTSYGLTSLGWDKGIKYYVAQPLTISFIGFVVNQEIFSQIDQRKQKDFEDTIRDFIEMITRMNRKNNQSTFELLKSKDVTPISFQDQDIKRLESLFQERVWNELKEKLYPSWLLTEILTRLSEYRVKGR